MRIGVTIPNNFGVDDPKKVIALAQAAEDLGYDSIWVMDHLFNAGAIQERLGDKPYYHPLSTLSYVAAKTERILLGTSVIVLPYHHPVELAKYAATLDHLSDGRLVLGTGTGLIESEFDALGVSFKERGRITTEAIKAIKALWTQGVPSFEGAYWNFSGLPFSPRPRQQPHPPIWVGGQSIPAMRRAATVGDGWHPYGIAPESCAERFQTIRDLASAAGRDPAALVMSVRIGVARDTASVLPGQIPPDTTSVHNQLAAYQVAGVEHAVLALDWGNPDELEAAMERTATEVLPSIR